MPKYCIVIPSYNNSDTLGEAVESALSQKFNDFSVIVSDNNSSDETAQVLSKFDDRRLKIFEHMELLPKSENWNRAYSYADDCEYLVNLHADDYLYKDCLKNIDDHSSEQTSLIHGIDNQVSWDKKDKKFHLPFPFNWTASGEEHKSLMIINNNVSIVGTAFSMKAFRKINGFSLDYNFLQDVQMWFDLSDYGLCKYVAKKMGAYRMAPSPPEPYLYEVIRWHEDLINSSQISESLKNLSSDVLLSKMNRIAKMNLSEDLSQEVRRVISDHKDSRIINIRLKNLKEKIKFIFSS